MWNEANYAGEGMYEPDEDGGKADLPDLGLGRVHTKQPEFDTIQVWKLQKLSTNA